MLCAAVPCIANLCYCSVMLARPEIGQRADLTVLTAFFVAIYVASWPSAILGVISFTEVPRSKMSVAFLTLFVFTILLNTYVVFTVSSLG